MFESPGYISRKARLGVNQKHDDEQISAGNFTWIDYIMIEPESRKKALFDVVVLFFVGYSCVTSVFNVAFKFEEPYTSEYTGLLDYLDTVVEIIFCVDLSLNFIWSYINPDT